ncbi:hypothetical protein [Shewanella algae]|uniref:hypothetical protein n=1 Tax=Shewanella algae TaxID=38313 RepID=UPI0031F4E764
MSVVYKTNPWYLPELADYPIWPFHDIDFWHLGNIIQEVRVQEEDFPAGISFHRKRDAHIRLRDAFLCAGILMSPAIYNGGPRAWAFFLEHAESLRASSGALRVKSDCIHWEERVRTIFSERFGLGLAGWMLWNSYDVLHIADAGPFIAKTISDPASPYNKKSLTSLGLYGQNGGLKPDLLCLTRSGECVIAESKGAIGPPSKLSSAKKKGKKQVENVNPNGVNVRANGGRLVFATNLRHEGENPQPTKDSSITVVDPTDSNGALEIEVSADEITLHSYCKLLSFCGMTHIVRSLLRGNSIDGDPELRQRYIEVGDFKVFPLLVRSGQVIGLEARVAEVLFQNPKNIFEATREVLPRNRDSAELISDEQVLIFPNGVVFGNVD